MKILDWWFAITYHGTWNQHSVERAHFGLWFSSSFVWVGAFYLILIMLRVQIGRPLFIPIFLSVFALNYFLLYRIYIKGNRSKLVVEATRNVTKSYSLFAKLFIVLSPFLSASIMLSVILYYGRNIGFL
jgi:hypothetical protein